MSNFILSFYGYFVFFYSMALIMSYVFLIWFSYFSLRKAKNALISPYVRKIVNNSPYTPGVSIIAPAYNEEETIISNVHSLLSLDYPKFELVIVNDGSKDNTLNKLIQEFSLVEVPYAYIERIKTRQFRRCFKSTLAKYEKLIVIDKENGGTKADASNAGINVSSYPYFVCTDVDCILDKDALFNCMLPIMQGSNVIAVSGCMNMVNGCVIKDGNIVSNNPPHSLIPLFQALEYLRSFLIGKMGWSAINAMPNVSGGFGLFDRQVAISAGGYKSDSLAEDQDMIIRMIGYCCDFHRDYRIVQIPSNCCWTEGPPNIKALYKQRTRWGHGLIQTLSIYSKMMFNKRYKRLGMITLPYQLVFELLAPIIEAVGFFTFIYLIFIGGINWQTTWIIFAAIFVFCIALSIVVIFYDYSLGGSYSDKRSYFWLVFAAITEPFLYHPCIVAFSLRGYFNYIVHKKIEWGEMKRKGFTESKNKA